MWKRDSIERIASRKANLYAIVGGESFKHVSCKASDFQSNSNERMLIFEQPVIKAALSIKKPGDILFCDVNLYFQWLCNLPLYFSRIFLVGAFSHSFRRKKTIYLKWQCCIKCSNWSESISRRKWLFLKSREFTEWRI